MLAQTAAVIEHVPEAPHWAFVVQAWPLRLHPPAMVGHCALLVQAALLTLQRPLAGGHARLLLTGPRHGNVVIEHCPGWSGHRFGGQTALVSEQ